LTTRIARFGDATTDAQLWEPNPAPRRRQREGALYESSAEADAQVTAERRFRRIASGVYRRLNRNSSWGLPWDHRGDFVTFRWHGFVEAPSIPLLFARHHYETAVIEQLLADKDVQRSLEFGCGFGRLTPTFARLSADHVAVDIDPKAVAAARTAYPKLSFQVFDGRSLPFSENTFNLVVTWTVLQHVPPEVIDDVLADILRVLRSDGRLLLCEETRSAGNPTRHSWHREPSFYEERFAPRRLTHSGYIEEIDRIPGLVSPGQVMLFEV
jgi:SAM-dependent methyltransferase